MSSDQNSSFVVSYIFLRRAVGVIGIALPIVLALGNIIIFSGSGILQSVSAYYYTGMRDTMVGFLFSIAIFLLAYRGLSWIDELAGKIGCFFAVGVALFPTSPPPPPVPTPLQENISTAHFAFAAGMFLTLAFFSLFLFTKTDPNKEPTPEKKERNVIYIVCGLVMLGAIGLIGLKELIGSAAINALNPTYWLEAVAVIAFGVSWLIKGETLFRDK
jgi:hypothetical protein